MHKSTIRQVDAATAEDARGLHLLVLDAAGSRVFLLPEIGKVLIGRGDNVQLDLPNDKLISRHHALLEIESSGPTIADLGSENGTWVREQRISAERPMALAIGDAIRVGSTVVLVRKGQPTKLPFDIIEHEDFEERLRTECTRARGVGGFLAVTRLGFLGSPTRGEVAAAAASTLSPSDALAIYSDNEYELLSIGLGPDEAKERLGPLATSLAGAGLELVERELDTRTAYYPYHGTTADALIAKASALAQNADEPEGIGGPVVVRDASMRAVHVIAEKAAASMVTVLLVGETGAGKTVVAETIHRASPRVDKPFLVLNCAALAESIPEAELFGYEKGAFTGAVGTTPGIFEAAEGGTVFLDEIGDLSLAIQPKLFHALENGIVRRVGGTKNIKIDVRLISATNKDLEAEIRRGAFREDLYYRIKVLSCRVPPLRERVPEIADFANTFIGHFSARDGKSPAPKLTDEALHALQAFSWPGNVRELRNAMERAVVLCSGAEITVDDLPENVVRVASKPTTPQIPAGTQPKDAEHARVLTALIANNGNQSRAAKSLGMQRLAFRRRLRKYGIPCPQDD